MKLHFEMKPIRQAVISEKETAALKIALKTLQSFQCNQKCNGEICPFVERGGAFAQRCTLKSARTTLTNLLELK